MNIMVFDTETTSIDKPFVYNIGYAIYNMESNTLLKACDYVVEQVWHNLPLFSTAYYANKRPIYVERMRARATIMDKFGYITQAMLRDIQNFNIEYAYAYNSPFDTRVFEYNCEWFKCINPFETVNILDIRALILNQIDLEDYKKFAEKNEKFTESGNYSTKAEDLYIYLTKNEDYVEEHTALQDSLDELIILTHCKDIITEMPCPKSIERKIVKPLTIYKNNEKIFETEYESITIRKEKTEIRLKQA